MKSDLESRYCRMGDADLLAIVHSHSSYRPDAQELARDLLLKRGVSEDTINQWRDPTAKLAITPWSNDLPESALRKMINRRRQVDNVILSLIIISGILWPLIEPADFDLIFLWYFIFFWYIALPCLLIRALLHGFTWRSPLRILLLRPFMLSKSRRRIRRFVKHYLRYAGHTYTISDVEIRPPGIFRVILRFLLQFPISIWFWQFFRTYFDVLLDEDIPKLKKFMGRRVARNIAWALSRDKLFKISCTLETWKHVMQHLINSAQLVVVDLSHVGEGLKWELEELRFYDSIGKVVVIAHEDSVASARSFLETCGVFGSDKELFVYGDNGRATRHKELIDTITCVAARPAAANNSFNRSGISLLFIC